MNTYQKHKENLEQVVFFKNKEAKNKQKIYYLQKCLKRKKISYSSKKKEVYPTSDQVDDKHVKVLGEEYNYNIQTIIN